MYEQFYGLSAPPFQINPDPGFYFESKGHGSAYQYLRFGAFQGEGFVVVTGEIGAGKTTLLRALLAELDPTRIVAAQLVSTQLAADDLLSAVALAFGINVEGLSKAKQLVTLEAYLASLATSNRRALLIIDEAQNLTPAAIEELRMLSNFQFGNKALLQSFLVGQPELRDILRLPHMEQLRQRVLASCHLGPMEPAETRGYIEHRLRYVGWKQRPGFDAAAFDAIHEATGGVPRRINTLCNRLLLSAFLDEAERIDAARVRRVDAELRIEISGKGGAGENGAAAVANSNSGPLLCLAGSPFALLAAGALTRALAAREDLPRTRLIRFVGDGAIDDDVAARRELQEFGLPDPGLRVELTATGAAARAAEVAGALAAQFDAQRPSALLLCSDGAIELASALAAAAAGLPVVRIGAADGGGVDAPARLRRRLLDQAAGLSFVADAADVERLALRNVDAGNVQHVGHLAVDAVRLALTHGANPELVLRREGVAPSVLNDPAGYVVLAPDDAAGTACDEVVALDARLREYGWRVCLLWPVPAQRRDELATRCAQAMAASVRVISLHGHGEWLGLMRHARCVLAASDWLCAEATALGIPSLGLGADEEPRESTHDGSAQRKLARELADIIASGGRRPPLRPMWDGHAAERIAAELSDWLLARQDPSYENFLKVGRRRLQRQGAPDASPVIAGRPSAGN